MERRGGLIREVDLGEYRAVERKPVRGTYRGHEVLSMPPPSSGGIALIEMLNILEGYDLSALGLRSARETHLVVESMRRAYADRALHLGDPDRVEVPVDRLTSKEHARELRRSIRLDRASRSSPTVFHWPAEGSETTHLSVIDRDRMAVSLTTTLEQAYGSRIVVPGAGFLLNNEMGDFNPVPGSTDEKGRIGTPPNLVAPGKRMLSSMTPTIVVRDGMPVLVVGSPGGRTIINTVLQVVLDVVDHGMPIQDAVDLPRFHHQWLPDRVFAEPRCFSSDTARALEALGHAMAAEVSIQGAVMALALRKAGDGRFRIEAGVDRRRPDTGSAGR
jgi:gamma-glutamyltranspeptidase/glutathione hydrolase